MNESEPSFNLLDQPWLPCIPLGKTHAELYSLRDTLIQAHSLRTIYADSPLVTAALYRLCLALLHRVFGPANPKEWKSLWQMRGGWQEKKQQDLEMYLQEWHDKFDLFSQGRFFQIKQKPDLKLNSVVTLALGMASGNNPVLFDHHTETIEINMTPAEATCELLSLQSFGLDMTAGSSARYPCASCARGVIFIAEGDTLFETLVLNLIAHPSQKFSKELTKQDRPAWEMEDPFTESRKQNKPLGYLDYLTWHSRRIWLDTTWNVASTALIVTRICIAPGMELPKEQRDLMKHYEPNQGNNKKEEPWLAVRFREGRALWRDNYVLFKQEDEKVRPPLVREWLAELSSKRFGYLDPTQRHKLRILALGMASNQADTLFWRTERMPLPLELLIDEGGALVGVLSNAMTKAEDVSKQALRPALNQLAVELIDTTKKVSTESTPDGKGKQKKKGKGEAEATAKSEDRHTKLTASWNTDALYWAQLESHYWNFVERLVHTSDAMERDAVRRGWYEILRSSAITAFDTTANAVGNTPRALKAVALAQIQLRGRLNADTLLGKPPRQTDTTVTQLFDGEEDLEDLDESTTN